MATINISKKAESGIKQVIEQTMRKEFAKMRAENLPYVSNAEQKDIEKRYGKPSRDFVKTLRVKI
ncbi:MAG TPA: hypothetical protein VI953_01005 [Candidatus Paceibacterota bacterium]